MPENMFIALCDSDLTKLFVVTLIDLMNDKVFPVYAVCTVFFIVCTTRNVST